MAWLYLLIAGAFEVMWAVQLKETQAFTKLVPSILTGISMVISLYFLALAIQTLPIGIAYVVWTGIGAIGTIIVGAVFMKEPCNMIQSLLLANIFLSMVGLKIYS